MEKRTGYRYIASPSRNFCVLNNQILTDPKDGKEKLVFTSFQESSVGILAIVDPVTDTGESYTFPCDDGAWAVCPIDGRRLAIGTCPRKAAIHTFDLVERRFIHTTYAGSGSQYVWNLVKASDGYLYGGTYPTNAVVKYDPETMEAECVAKCDGIEGNLYSRTVYADVKNSGNLIISCGMKKPEVCVYNVYENKVVKNIPGNLRSVNDLYFEVDPDRKDAFYDGCEGDGAVIFDRVTCEMLPDSARASLDEKLASMPKSRPSLNARTYKQGYKYVDSEGKVHIRRYPVEAPASGILGMNVDKNGAVWASSGFGQTICRLDPDTGKYSNTNVVTNAGGEVYAVVPVDDRIYLTAYSSGAHVVYYPDREWDEENNVNPHTFYEASKDGYIRPQARSFLSPKGYIYTGFSADYGTYGGAVTRIDTATNEIKLWKNDISDCAVNFVFADDAFVYAVTGTGGNGLPARNVPVSVIKFTPDLDVIWHKEYEGLNVTGAVFDGKYSYALCIYGKKAFFVKSSDHFETFESKELPAAGSNLKLLCGTDHLVYHEGSSVVRIDKNASEISRVTIDGGRINQLAVTSSGRVFVTCSEKVYEVYPD